MSTSAGLPSRVAAEVKESLAIASHLGGHDLRPRAHAFVSAMHVALLTASGVALTAAAVVVVLLSRRAHRVVSPFDNVVASTACQVD